MKIFIVNNKMYNNNDNKVSYNERSYNKKDRDRKK